MKYLNQMGQKLAEFFKESTPLDGASSFKGNSGDMLNQDCLSDLLPYRLYDKSTKIFENASSFGFVLELPPTLGMSSQSQKEISALIRDIGEEGASVQCLMWADPRISSFLKNWSKPRNAKEGIFKRVADKKNDFFKELSLDGDVQPRIFRFVFSYSIPKPSNEKNSSFFISSLIEKRKKAVATFQRFGSVLDVNAQDFLDILSGFVNVEQGVASHTRKKWNKDAFLSQQIGLPGGGIEVREKELIYHGKLKTAFRSYEAVDFPDQWSMHLSGNLIGDFFNASYRMPSAFFIHYGIFFPLEDPIKMKLKSKGKLLDHQTKFASVAKACPEMVKESEENLFTQRQLMEGEKLVQTRLNVGLWSSLEKIHNSESILISLFQKYGFKLKECTFQHFHDFLFSLPMTWGESTPYMRDYKRRMLLRTTLTLETANLIPFVGEWWGNSKQGQMLQGRRGQLATWDPFSSDGNLNTVVVGPSGSGKSVFMQDLIMSELGRGTRVFVLDLGRSFEKLCHLLGGQYLFFSEGSRLNLNPFNLIKTEGDVESTNIILEMVSSIIATMAMPAEKIDKERADILSTIVKKVWDSKGRKATVDDVISFIEKTKFKSELMKGATESLKEGLKKFSSQGVYANYFYGKKKINFEASFVVIETEELKNMPDLQAVILQIFALNISTQIFMGSREQRSLVCIDEAWDLLKSPQMEGFIESMARRLRKYNGALLIGTQGLKDFERSHGARAAFQNSNWLLMLGKDDDSINILKEKNLIAMDDQKEQMLNSLRKEDGKYSEVFIYHKGTGFHALCQLKLDPFSSLLYSTKASDFQAIEELKNRGIPIEKALEWLLENKSSYERYLADGYRIADAIESLIKKSPKCLSKSLDQNLISLEAS